MNFSCDLTIEGVDGTKQSLPGRFKYAMSSFTIPTIGFFWDFENIRVPKDKSGYTIIQRLRENFLQDRFESEFIVVCDIRKERDDVLDEINQAQVKIVHVRSTAKNSCDEKLKTCMSQFVQNNGPGSTLVLLSSDINFCPFLAEFRYMKKINIILIHNAASNYLLNICNENFPFSLFTEDLPPRRVEKPLQPAYVMVTGLPQKMPEFSVKKTLSLLTDNRGGKVLSVTGSTAVIKFASTEYAVQAQRRLKNETVGKKKITATFFQDINRVVTRGLAAKMQQSGRPVHTDWDINQGASASGTANTSRQRTDSSDTEDDEPRRTASTSRQRTDSSDTEDDEPQRRKQVKFGFNF
ncbi:Meiosis regulator and mRNA stability factor 1 [Araneus ventricosus]|uniref:Meiosis regulator and mRNA stability factor 1 n=1 Tax=Araneus ventricosus TaxID=182803 RepID=A0A4Y2QDW4_ARAVE|nr:Meiosis regulator and mRNA stability factor 1 [Araneus ventricosus]